MPGWTRFYARRAASRRTAAGAGGPTAEFVAFVLSPAGRRTGATAIARRCCASRWRRRCASLARRFGADPAAWRWGEAHQAIFAHPLLRTIPVLGALETISIPTPGDDNTLDRGGMRRRASSRCTAPAYRGVYDLADLDRSLFMVAPGQSGNPFSRPRKRFFHALA